MFQKFFISFIILILTTSILKPDDKHSVIIKINNDKNQIEKQLSGKIRLPVYFNFLTKFKQQNTQLSSKLNAQISKLLSYRIASLDEKELYELASNNDIEIEPNYTYKIEQDNTKPNDPRYPEQWALEYLQAEKIWKISSGKNVIVGVVDTGIEWEHEDLKNQLWINKAEDLNHNGTFEPWDYRETRNGLTGDLNNIDDDGNGFTDDVIGYDFVNQAYQNLGDWSIGDPIPFDENGHGTLVSGVIAAQHNNNKGISGLAYDSKIMTMRCFDINGSSFADNISSSIIYAVSNGAKVLNLSFGEKHNSSMMYDAIKFAIESGCIVVASAGNEGSNSPHYPSDDEGVISVGYSNKLNKRDNFSNYGQRLTLVAPGVKILTTTFTGDYKEVSGSSLSAPYVSATAALLLEKNPTLTSEDISGIISASADDAGIAGWDDKYGAGILNIIKAVNYPGITNLIISEPINDALINREGLNNTSINFIGSVITPLFLNYEILNGKGINPEEWSKLNESTNQILKDTIYSLDVSNFIDTTYTFRIKVNLRNNGTLEKRIRFTLYSSQNKLKFVNIKSLPVFSNGRRIPILAIETNRESIVNIKLLNSQDSVVSAYSDYYSKTRYHVIPINDFRYMSGNFKILITAYENFNKRADEINTTLNVNMPESSFMTDKFIKKDYSTKLAYLFNQVTDFNEDGKPEFAANDLSYGIWNGTDIYEFDNGKLNIKDSTKSIHIPVGIGDSNGDGIKELLTKDLGSLILFQGKTKEQSPLSSILFADTTSGNMFAGAMYDFTGDGKDEIIAYSDTAVYIISYVDSKYKIVATALNEKEYRKIGTAPGILCGDFDGDGKNELCFGNSRGNVFIWEFNNNTLTPEYSNLNDYSDSPQYLVKADIDNDGIEEIITANFGNSILFDRNVDAQQVWQLKVLKSIGPNNYSYIYGEYFYPVKQGSTPGGVFYRNGLSAGNIGTKGDAILFSPYPDFYSFIFDSVSRKIIPFWHYPDAFANSAIVYDFDKNGINEIGFSTSRGTQFFEYARSRNPNSAIEISGWSISDSSILLNWKNVKKDLSASPVQYKITYGIVKNDVIELLETVFSDSTSVILSGFLPGNDYWFGIESISTDNQKSEINSIVIHHHIPLKTKSVTQINQQRFIFQFTGNVSDALPIASEIFSFIDSSGEHKSFVLGKQSDSSFIVTWEQNLDPGNGTFIIKSFRDYYYAPSYPTQINFSVVEDEKKPVEIYLKNIKIITSHELELEYSESVISNEAENLANYKLKPLGEIKSIESTANPSVFKINLDEKSPIGPLGKVYSLTVTNVNSLDGKEMTKGAGNTISFVFSSSDLSFVFVYPNPIRMSESPQIYFANLTVNSMVYIYNDHGAEIISLKETDGNGGIEWDGRDKNGVYLNSGIYYYKVKNVETSGAVSETELKKFAVIR